MIQLSLIFMKPLIHHPHLHPPLAYLILIFNPKEAQAQSQKEAPQRSQETQERAQDVSAAW